MPKHTLQSLKKLKAYFLTLFQTILQLNNKNKLLL